MYLRIPETIVTEFGLQVRQDGEGIGAVDDVPLIFKVITDDPLSLMFKFRVTVNTATVELPEELRSLIDNDKASFSIENHVAWLTFYDASVFDSAKPAVFLVRAVLQVLRDEGLAVARECVGCRRVGAAGLVYHDGEITWICQNWFQERADQRAIEEARQNPQHSVYLLGIPLALAAATAVWAFTWYLYDRFFEWLGAERIIVPNVAVLIVAVALAGRPRRLQRTSFEGRPWLV